MKKALIVLAALPLVGCPKAAPYSSIQAAQPCPGASRYLTIGAVSPAPCPSAGRVDAILLRVAAHYNLRPEDFANIALVYVPGAVSAGGGEYLELADVDNGTSAVSTWPLHDLTEHTLCHHAIYKNGNHEIDHLRLDHPDAF